MRVVLKQNPVLGNGRDRTLAKVFLAVWQMFKLFIGRFVHHSSKGPCELELSGQSTQQNEHPCDVLSLRTGHVMPAKECCTKPNGEKGGFHAPADLYARQCRELASLVLCHDGYLQPEGPYGLVAGLNPVKPTQGSLAVKCPPQKHIYVYIEGTKKKPK